jgi:hypothetical protein
MPDLPGSNKTYCTGIIVVGAVRVNVILLTGLLQNLFGLAIDIGYLVALGGEVGGRNVLEHDLARFFQNSYRK